MFKMFKVSCDEATTICDKSQYNEATLLEKIKLNWHLLMCRVCSKYVIQNRTMTGLFKMKASDCKNHKHCLSSDDKDLLKEKLKKVTLK